MNAFAASVVILLSARDKWHSAPLRSKDLDVPVHPCALGASRSEPESLTLLGRRSSACGRSVCRVCFRG